MEDVLKKLTNIRSLRAMMREISLEAVQEIESKIITVANERREEEEAELQAKQQRNAKLNEYLAMMQEDGINPEDLISAPAQSQKKPRAKRPAKYAWMEDGERRTWTGQGRKPSFIKDALEAGQSLDEFKIAVNEGHDEGHDEGDDE